MICDMKLLAGYLALGVNYGCIFFLQFDKENERDLWQSFVIGISVVSLFFTVYTIIRLIQHTFKISLKSWWVSGAVKYLNIQV